MKYANEIAEEAVMLVASEDNQGAAHVLIKYSEELSNSSDEVIKDIADQLSFCGLRIFKNYHDFKVSRVQKNELDQMAETIRNTNTKLSEALDTVFHHLREFEHITYKGTFQRSLITRGRMEEDSTESINTFSERINNREELAATEWALLVEKFKKQLEYYENWLPCPKTGLMSAFATHGFIKAGHYPRYVRLIQHRINIERLIKDIEFYISEIPELYKKYDELQSVYSLELMKAEVIIEEIRMAASPRM